MDALDGAPRGWGGQVSQTLKEIGPWRLIGGSWIVAFALLVARFGWSIPLVDHAECALYDLRSWATAPRMRHQDPRITLVPYDTVAAERTHKRSPPDRGLLAKALIQIDAMHPRAIGIDILIDQQQPEDEELLAALNSLRTPTWLAYANHQTTEDVIEFDQEDYLRQFHARLTHSHVKPASILLQQNLDNAVRQWAAWPAGLPVPLALALIPGHPGFPVYAGGIVFRRMSRSSAIYPTTSINSFVPDPKRTWDEQENLTRILPQLVQGKFVLIGGELQGNDTFATPSTIVTHKLRWGLQIHADMLAQALDGRWPAPIPAWTSVDGGSGRLRSFSFSCWLRSRSGFNLWVSTRSPCRWSAGLWGG